MTSPTDPADRALVERMRFPSSEEELSDAAGEGADLIERLQSELGSMAGELAEARNELGLNPYRSVAGWALSGTDEADELAKLPIGERERETIRRVQARIHAYAATVAGECDRLREAARTALEWLDAVPGRYGAIGELNREKLRAALLSGRGA